MGGTVQRMSHEARLSKLGIELPEPPQAGGNYVSSKVVGSLCYLAGVISQQEGMVISGVVGADRTVEEGYTGARACGMTQLSVLRQTLGSLDRVVQVVSVNGYVNAVRGFKDSPRSLMAFLI